MSAKNPGAPRPESSPAAPAADEITYHNDLAQRIVEKHADGELSNEDRKRIQDAVAQHVLEIIENSDGDDQAMKNAFGRLINRDLAKDFLGTDDETEPEDDETEDGEDEPVDPNEIPANLEQGDESGNNFVMRWRHKMVIALGTPAAVMSKAWGRFTKNDVVKHNSRVRRHEGESDADYYNRMKSHAKTTAGMAAVALAGAASGGVGALGVGGFAGAMAAKGGAVAASIGNAVYQTKRKDREFSNPIAAAAGGLVGAAAGYSAAHDIISHHNSGGNNPVEFDGNKKDGTNTGDHHDGHDQHQGPHDHDLTPDQSRQLEHDWLERTQENGRLGHDYNHIDVDASKEDVLGQLHEQYEMSPNELAGQLHQIQGLEAEHGGHIPGLPEDLQMRDGESYDDYTARLGEALHNNNTLHHDMADYATNYAKDHYNVQDMPNHYRSSWIDENGKVHWDDEVRTADPDDKIINLGNGKGIRLPCGQPVELIPETQGSAPAPAGTVATTSAPTESHPGNPGNPTQPTNPEGPVNPPTPEQPNPPTPENPNPEPPAPEEPPTLDSKNEADNINANPNLQPGLGVGDDAPHESGELDTNPTAPSDTYTAPAAPEAPAATIPDATDNGRGAGTEGSGEPVAPVIPNVEQNQGDNTVQGTVER